MRPESNNAILFFAVRLAVDELEHVHQLFVFLRHIGVVVFTVRYKAVRAVLDVSVLIDEIAAAVLSERVERTVTEEAVELLRMCRFVAGELFALAVLKEIEMTIVLRFEHGLISEY